MTLSLCSFFDALRPPHITSNANPTSCESTAWPPPPSDPAPPCSCSGYTAISRGYRYPVERRDGRRFGRPISTNAEEGKLIEGVGKGEGTYGEVREVGGEVIDAGPGVHPDPGVDYTQRSTSISLSETRKDNQTTYY